MKFGKSPVIRHDEKSLVILDEAREWVFVADPEGRMEMVHTPATTFKRSRFNQWFTMQTEPWPGLRETAAPQIASAVSDWADAWKRALDTPRISVKLQEILQKWIDRFLNFHEADGREFASLFRTIPILPPDAYRALYVKVQEGCPWNRCAFCAFYKDERYRVLPFGELEQQAARLRAYWGSAVRSRHGLFLGDANAVAVPAPVLAQHLDLIRRSFPEPELAEFHSFVDYFAGPGRSLEDWLSLRRRGLRRLSLGIESGSALLMEVVDKPANPQDIIRMVHAAREAGIAMNLIFLVGLGGRPLREEHLVSSLRLIQPLALQRNDRIFLSPLVIQPAEPYASLAARVHWEPLSEAELKAEVVRWQTRIREVTAAQISPYHIRQFIY